VQFQGKLILILWVSGGQERPYKAPVLLSKKSAYASYIRRFSNTVKANKTEERELNNYAAIPFDDRINHHYEVSDLKPFLLKEFLKETNSNLYNDFDKIPFDQLCRQMEIADGSKEYLKPKNIGLMFFNDHPEKIFKKSQIEIVHFIADASGREIQENVFEGPIHLQLKSALAYIKNMFVSEMIQKVSGKAEANRFFNYPYAALEEALVNAIYHRSYEIREPVEVRIHNDKIEIVSYPGPDHSIAMKDLQKGNVTARRYRNRRIGDFLKELKLTEGRCTGIPTIIKAMKWNKSPAPVFKTDKNRTYFITVLPIHSMYKKAPVEPRVKKNVPSLSQVVSSKSIALVLQSAQEKSSLKTLMELAKYTNRTRFRNEVIKPLIEAGLLALTIPEKPQSSKQKYYTTDKGKAALKK
jgi:ATP-dependent DNA helicase RecG